MPQDTPRRPPHFLGLGVMRGGTTWLWKQLAQHPDVWLPPVKELNYFTRRNPIQIVAQNGIRRTENQPNLFIRSLDRFRWSRLTHYAQTYSPSTILWRWRFYRGPLTHEWYRSLFDPAGTRMSGDITPHYSALGEAGIAEIVETLPGVRCMLALRDPIDRDWSHAVHFLTTNKKRDRDSLTETEILDLIHNPSVRSRGDYLPMLEKWDRALPSEEMKILFFDDIRSRPRELLTEIDQFLGLPVHHPAGLERKINQSNARTIPNSIERHLADMHLPALEQLADRFGHPVTDWLDHARSVLS